MGTGLFSTIHSQGEGARAQARAGAEGLRSSPTVFGLGADGAEVFRAEGVPTLNQGLVAAAHAL